MEGKEDFVSNLRPNHASPPPVFKRRSNSFKWMILTILGVIILFAGSIWVSMATWNPPPNSSDYSNYQDYAKDLRAWKNFTMSGNYYGRIVMELGSFVMIIAGLFGYMDGTLDSDEKKILLALAILGIVILVIVSVGLFVISPYSSSVT